MACETQAAIIEVVDGETIEDGEMSKGDQARYGQQHHHWQPQPRNWEGYSFDKIIIT